MVAPASITWHGQDQELDAALQAKIMQRTPLRRLGNAMESAQAVLFFIEQADYTTGQVLAVKDRCGLTQTGPLAASKGVNREVESEGSLRQIKAVTNRN